MIDSSTAPRARLFTAFGTVLYVDVASGELRHGAIESNPANAFFVADPSAVGSRCWGWLAYDSGDSLEPIVCLPDRCQRISQLARITKSVAPTLLELIPLERGLIAFRADALFISSIPDGRVKLSAPKCSTWELFLASEDWQPNVPDTGTNPILDEAAATFDHRGIKSHVIHPTTRVRANAKAKARKLLIFAYTKWSHGRVHSDLCEHLHQRGYIVDILDWRVDHADYIDEIIPYYDLFLTALDGVGGLANYGVPYGKIIAVSHGEFDIRMLIEEKGIEVFEQFANYGVLSEFLYCASLVRGVKRIPRVASLGVNYTEFHAEIPERLATVGYATSMSLETYGVELKRGELVAAAVHEAGLEFKVAGSTRNQIRFEDMPDFYRTVDAVVASSISEGAGLMVMEAAAAGRLVIGTPVGHFPLKAYQGGGILAPVEAEKFKAFTTATLRYYKENPAAYVDKCRAIQDAARKFDWQYTIGDWINLIEEAKLGSG